MNILSEIVTVSGIMAAMFIAFSLMVAGMAALASVLLQMVVHSKQLRREE